MVLAFGRIPLRLTAQWLLGIWIAYQFVQVVLDTGGDVAWIAHIGGLAAGAVLIVFLKRRTVPLFDKNMT